MARRDRNLIGALNVGAPLTSYSVSFVPDRGVDWLDPVDRGMEPIPVDVRSLSAMGGAVRCVALPIARDAE